MLQLRRWKFVVNFCGFWSKFLWKMTNLGLSPILGKLGVTHDLDWWLVGKPMVDFLFTLIELLRCLLRFRSYNAKCVQHGFFHRGRPLCTQILPRQGHPLASILGARKLIDTGLLNRENRFPLHSLCIPECDGWTDRRICHSIYSHCTTVTCHLHCKNLKAIPSLK